MKNGRNIILFGSPGVGKGAQAEVLCERESIPHLSTGAVLRDEIAKGTSVGRRVQEAVERGEFADDDTILGLVSRALDQPEFQSGFVMDGFPRTVAQAKAFDSVLRKRGRSVDYAIFIDSPEETILRRLGGRRVCESCGKTYHVDFAPPEVSGRCDECSGSVIQRPDDTAETHRERLRVFRERTHPVLDFYRHAGLLVRVDGSPSIDEVARAIQSIFEDESATGRVSYESA